MESRQKELRISGIAYSVLLLLLYFLKFNEYTILLYISATLLLLAIIFPKGILPINFVMRPMGEFLIDLLVKMILSLIFFLMLTPIALVRRISNVRVIDRRFEPTRNSYFVDKAQVEYNKDFFEKL